MKSTEEDYYVILSEARELLDRARQTIDLQLGTKLRSKDVDFQK
jgi:hypothetical protein